MRFPGDLGKAPATGVCLLSLSLSLPPSLSLSCGLEKGIRDAVPRRPWEGACNRSLLSLSLSLSLSLPLSLSLSRADSKREYVMRFPGDLGKAPATGVCSLPLSLSLSLSLARADSKREYVMRFPGDLGKAPATGVCSLSLSLPLSLSLIEV